MSLVKPEEFFFTYLKNATHGASMNRDGSVTPITYESNIPPGFNVYVHAVNLMLACKRRPGPLEFGDLAPLTNGLEFFYEDANGREVRLPKGLEADDETYAVKSNIDLGNVVGETWRIEDSHVQASWVTQNDTGGSPLLFESGSKIRATVNDNLSDLLYFRVTVVGIKLDATADVTGRLNSVKIVR